MGLDLKLINILSIEDVSRLMKSSGVYGGRCLISAEIIREYSEVLELKGLQNGSSGLKMKSLVLYIEAILSKELPVPENYYQTITELIKEIPEELLTEEIKVRIFEYYEAAGMYSKAEDILFELMQSGSDEIYEKGVSFYKRLNLKSEEELIKGNLSMEEIKESLMEIQNLKSNS